MNPAAAMDTISALQTDINGLENTILFCRNRILAKRAAIEEILQAHEVRSGVAIPSPGGEGQGEGEPSLTTCDKLSVVEMLQGVLSEMNGDTFWYRELMTRMNAKYPGNLMKIKRGIYNASHRLLELGELKKVPGGMARNHREPEAAARA